MVGGAFTRWGSSFTYLRSPGSKENRTKRFRFIRSLSNSASQDYCLVSFHFEVTFIFRWRISDSFRHVSGSFLYLLQMGAWFSATFSNYTSVTRNRYSPTKDRDNSNERRTFFSRRHISRFIRSVGSWIHLLFKDVANYCRDRATGRFSYHVQRSARGDQNYRTVIRPHIFNRVNIRRVRYSAYNGKGSCLFIVIRCTFSLISGFFCTPQFCNGSSSINTFSHFCVIRQRSRVEIHVPRFLRDHV